MPAKRLNKKQAWLLAVLVLGGCVHRNIDAAPGANGDQTLSPAQTEPRSMPYDDYDDEDDDGPIVISI